MFSDLIPSTSFSNLIPSTSSLRTFDFAAPGGGADGGGFHGSGSLSVLPETLDDGFETSAEKAADDNLGFLNQLVGSLTGENQRILQNLMREATKAQYDYEEKMSSTAYQRAVSDMRKAGLNPAVMFASGAGNSASTPSVGIANVATENQLLTFFSSAGALLTGLGSLLGSVLPKNYRNISQSFIKYLK